LSRAKSFEMVGSVLHADLDHFARRELMGSNAAHDDSFGKRWQPAGVVSRLFEILIGCSFVSDYSDGFEVFLHWQPILHIHRSVAVKDSFVPLFEDTQDAKGKRVKRLEDNLRKDHQISK